MVPVVVEAPAVVPQVLPTVTDPPTPSRRRPARTIGLVGTNAAFLVPDYIRKKFMDGWVSHVPLTYLTDKGCTYKNDKVSSATDILSFDPATGQVTTTSKSLLENGELDLTFDEWHQAWRRLLDLIQTFLPEEFLLWEKHFLYILNSENRAELWLLYLAYDTEIRRRATQYPIDPSLFSIGIWNDLEARYATKKILNMVQVQMRQHPERYSSHSYNNPSSYIPRIPSQNTSFRNQQQPPGPSETSKAGRCIFCGDRSKTHSSRNCDATSCVNGAPCHMFKQGPSGIRQNSSGRRYCFAWNGTGCIQTPCSRGEHWCTLCGSRAHNAQQCTVVP
jgi:hypothetical protein